MRLDPLPYPRAPHPLRRGAVVEGDGVLGFGEEEPALDHQAGEDDEGGEYGAGGDGAELGGVRVLPHLINQPSTGQSDNARSVYDVIYGGLLQFPLPGIPVVAG